MLTCVKVLLPILTIVLIQSVAFSDAVVIDPLEWSNYTTVYDKDYINSAITEPYAKYYYSYNKNLINRHNTYFDRGTYKYTLRINQFTDMRLIHFNALFPVTTQPTQSFNSTPPAVGAAPAAYDARDLGYNFTAEDQGSKCNSGWAYAAVKAIELMQATQMGTLNPASISAQSLIDCAGQSSGCKNQVPQTAFDFLSQYGQDLYLATEYPNNKNQAEQGMCVPMGIGSANLGTYARIDDGNDDTMKMYVAAGYPVVIEINPTSFEFMHYGGGVFEPPRTSSGSHFMPVVGYGHDAVTNLDYWLALNSFGKLWGEEGYIRIARSTTIKLAKSAIFPTELA